jgi:uncharacterized protein (TIGR02145 family)
MNEILSKQEANRYIVGVSYVFPQDILSESESSRTVVITLKSGKVWNTIYFTPGTAKLVSTGTVEFAGEKITSQFDMDLPGGGASFGSDIARICHRPIILRFDHSNGEIFIAGGRNRKLRLSMKRSTDVKSGYVLSFEYESRCEFKHIALTESVVTPLAAPGVPTLMVIQPTVTNRFGMVVVTSPKQGLGFYYSVDDGVTWGSDSNISGLTPSTSYKVRIKRTSDGAVSAAVTVAFNAAPAVEVPAAAPAPGIPMVVITQPTDMNRYGRVEVIKPSQGTGFYYSADNGVTWGSDSVIEGLMPSTTYHIMVKRTNDGAVSAAVTVTFNVVPAATVPTVFPAPGVPTVAITQPTMENNYGTAVITSPAQGTGFYYSLDNGVTWGSDPVMDGLVPSTIYQFRIKRTSDGGISAAVTVSILAVPIPNKPTIRITPPTTKRNYATIELTASEPGIEYLFNLDGGVWTSSVIYDGLIPGTTHSIRAKRIDDGAISSPLIFTTPLAPPKIKYGYWYNGTLALNPHLVKGELWRVPSVGDYQILSDSLGGNTVSGAKLKEIGLVHWKVNTGATDEIGFSARPGGERFDNGPWTGIGSTGYFLTTTPYQDRQQNVYVMDTTINFACGAVTNIGFGGSIRLVRDLDIATDRKTGIYVGHNGRGYDTIVEGLQEWTSENLVETLLEDGSAIVMANEYEKWIVVEGHMCEPALLTTNVFE